MDTYVRSQEQYGELLFSIVGGQMVLSDLYRLPMNRRPYHAGIAYTLSPNLVPDAPLTEDDWAVVAAIRLRKEKRSGRWPIDQDEYDAVRAWLLEQ